MRDPSYVADPREPRPQPRLIHRWVAVAVAAVIVLAVAAGWLLFAVSGRQDPALEVGAPAPVDAPGAGGAPAAIATPAPVPVAAPAPTAGAAPA